ncbi:MAG: glycine--tRNA ligase subunit beta [Terriglobales bacterium]
MADFLLEIGLEEIPARMIDAAEEELRKRVSDLLARESLIDSGKTSGPAKDGPDRGTPASPTHEWVESFSTPRRLAVLARGIAETQSDVEEQVTGPSVKVAYKDGQPTAAAQAFAKKVSVDLAQLQKVTTPKGEYIAAKVTRKGRKAAEILAESLPGEINALYWAKNMYWRAGKPERFVRPVRWMVALLDGTVVPVEYGGVKAGKTSRGHRLLTVDGRRSTAAQGSGSLEFIREVEIKTPASYAAALKEAAVIATREERVQMIRKALDAATRQVAGARWREDKELLDTVVNLTEFPSVILGNFEREFLALPEEVLVTVMRDHQKYFAVEDASGKLAPHFLAVLNTNGDPSGIIRHGHERVLRARFNDARFFWTVDQKSPLEKRVEMLKSVTFQKDLGSYHEKAQRMVALAGKICDSLGNTPGPPNTGADRGTHVDREAVKQAALLAKTDLTTELVKEFTELQGVVGGLYARHQGLGEKVATAIYDQYKPASMEDEVPRTVEAAVVSIADKADSIAGMFALGLVPSGSKDPFALRRAANGIVKTIAEHKLPVLLTDIFEDALFGYTGTEAAKRFRSDFDDRKGRVEVLAEIVKFFIERLEFYLKDVLGFQYDVMSAVLNAGLDDVVNAVARAHAVAKVRESEDFEHIAVAFKRIKNILRQANTAAPAEGGRATPDRSSPVFDPNKVKDDAERALAEVTAKTAPRVRELSQKREYEAALAEIATIRPAVDTFFDKVMVMVEDENVRSNRLALLQGLLNEFSTIADFSEIVTEKK